MQNGSVQSTAKGPFHESAKKCNGGREQTRHDFERTMSWRHFSLDCCFTKKPLFFLFPPFFFDRQTSLSITYTLMMFYDFSIPFDDD
jgi:hypothetical protein